MEHDMEKLKQLIEVISQVPTQGWAILLIACGGALYLTNAHDAALQLIAGGLAIFERKP
jgi:hypothetical protein